MGQGDRLSAVAPGGWSARGRVVVVTGGASGIGAALARRYARDGARVVVADRDAAAARTVAAEIGGTAQACDVAQEAQTIHLIDDTESRIGPIALFCANAGVSVRGGEELPDRDWQRLWDINLMAHVHAARALVPRMLARGKGRFLFTASAAGLLSQFDAPYAVTKHAAVAFAEWLSITYGDRGIVVSCLCPGGVDTPLFRAESAQRQALMSAQVISPEAVADVAVRGVAEGRALVLSHPDVQGFVERRATEHERWLRGMRRLHARADR